MWFEDKRWEDFEVIMDYMYQGLQLDNSIRRDSIFEYSEKFNAAMSASLVRVLLLGDREPFIDMVLNFGSRPGSLCF
jgi:hypothetical protein